MMAKRGPPERFIFVVTLLGALFFLVLATCPGLFEEGVLVSPNGCVVLPLIGLWLLLIGAQALTELKQNQKRREPPWAQRSLVLVLVAVVCLWLHIPQRVVFVMHRMEFAKVAEKVSIREHGGDSYERYIGVYQVEQIASDPSGGTYFQTHSHLDGAGPTVISYGFASSPNGSGCPFGRTNYRQHHLFGSWYAFEVSNKW